MTNRVPIVVLLSAAFLACGTQVNTTVDAMDTSEPDAAADAAAEVTGSSSCGPDPAPDFEDHTVAGFETPEAFITFNDAGSVPVQGKYILTDFSDVGGPTYYMDPTFYSLHDEWFWFRLLNGAAIPCLDVETEDFDLETIDAVYEAFQPARDGAFDLPLDLRFTPDGRLYSPLFYELGLFEEPRFFGLGSVLHYPAHPDRVLPEALWLFELQFGDTPSISQVERFYERLKGTLPVAVADDLRWLARSNDQEQLGVLLNLGDGPLRGKVVTYADLVVAGNVESYNDGIVAGRITRVPKGELGAAAVGPSDIVVLEEVPDYLPPVAAIITGVPQTPLAHLNLLAKSRGTPNAHIAGVMDDPALKTWEYYKRPVILKVAGEQVVWEEMTNGEYERYREKLEGPAMVIPEIDLSDAPWTLDLTEGGLAELAERVPLTGGKAAAMAVFNDFPTIRVPNTPMAITVRAYADHMTPLQSTLETLMEEPTFEASAFIRFVVLEGEEDFRDEHAGSPDALEWLEGFLTDHGSETLLGGLVADGGLKRRIRDLPLDATLDAALNETIQTHFFALAPTQGLRFRSSSTAEDIQGFNGAGLYDSNTGYLDPTLQTESKLKDRDVAWALKKTWASYWGFEAFEERRVAGIDHLSGHMGVLVHPRFDDAYEEANGVITLYLARESTGDRLEMIVNAQTGAISVTNPDPEDPTTPEIARVARVGDAPSTTTYVQRSSELPVDTRVVEADALNWLFEALGPLAQAWLEHVNGALPLPQHRSTLVLDFEFKRMADGWPALATEVVTPGGLVLKQVRTLDSAIPALDPAIVDDTVPRDILEQVVEVVSRRCDLGSVRMETTDYFTDPADAWALDYATVPFTSSVTLSALSDVTQLDIGAGESLTLSHVDVSVTHPDMDAGAPWTVEVTFDGTAAVWGLTSLTLTEGGAWSLHAGDVVLTGDGVSCEVEQLHEGAAAYLATLLASD